MWIMRWFSMFRNVFHITHKTHIRFINLSEHNAHNTLTKALQSFYLMTNTDIHTFGVITENVLQPSHRFTTSIPFCGVPVMWMYIFMFSAVWWCKRCTIVQFCLWYYVENLVKEQHQTTQIYGTRQRLCLRKYLTVSRCVVSRK